MKKALVGVALVWAGTCFAQTSQKQRPGIEKGTGVLSVDVPFGMEFSSSSSQPSGAKSSSQLFVFKPTLSGGGFVCRNFMLGLGFGIVKGWSRVKSGPFVERSATPTFLMPSLVMRYYVMFTEKVGFYAQLSGEAMVLTRVPREGLTVSAALAPRLVFFPKPGWGINAGFGELGYRYQESIPNGNVNAKQQFHDFFTEPTLTVGASYFFHKKKA